MKYTVWIEGDERGYSAISPDVPGFLATGNTREQMLERVKSGIPAHLEAMRNANLPMPTPGTPPEDAPKGMSAVIIELEPQAAAAR